MKKYNISSTECNNDFYYMWLTHTHILMNTVTLLVDNKKQMQEAGELAQCWKILIVLGKGPRYDSQIPHYCSQLSSIPVAKDVKPSFDFCGHQAYTWCIYICMQAKCS